MKRTCENGIHFWFRRPLGALADQKAEETGRSSIQGPQSLQPRATPKHSRPAGCGNKKPAWVRINPSVTVSLRIPDPVPGFGRPIVRECAGHEASRERSGSRLLSGSGGGIEDPKKIQNYERRKVAFWLNLYITKKKKQTPVKFHPIPTR